MKIIGLTGNIACGKSTVAAIFKELGATLIDADKVARDIVGKGNPALGKIVNHFGNEILNKDGTLNREKLGRTKAVFFLFIIFLINSPISSFAKKNKVRTEIDTISELQIIYQWMSFDM